MPGSDATQSYLPAEAKIGPASVWRWTVGHPLEEISRHPPGIPPRCLIPHFPDDPKSRYLDELDSELKGRSSDGEWTSVKSVEQFWDAMSFRQECSAGRMVGFLWVVFTPRDQGDFGIGAPTNESRITDSQTSVDENVNPALFIFTDPPSTPATSLMPSSQILSPLKTTTRDFSSNAKLSNSPTRRERLRRRIRKRKLRGIIIPRQPRVKTKNSLRVPKFPERTAYYSCPAESRGQVVLVEKDYKRVADLLLRLDFADEVLASQSSGRWISEVRAGVISSDEPWGVTITGTQEPEQKANAPSASVNSLNMGLVRKKRKPDSQDSIPTAASAINVLGSGMVRKKGKT